MKKLNLLLTGTLVALITSSPGQDLGDAEVRLPFAKLARLLEQGTPAQQPPSPDPVLRTIRLRIVLDSGRPALDATFGVTAYGSPIRDVPLIAGPFSVSTFGPEDSVLLAARDWLTLRTSMQGSQEISMRLIPAAKDRTFSFTIPACASAFLDTSGTPDSRSIAVSIGDAAEENVGASMLPLAAGATVKIRLLDPAESAAATRPPEPSEWSWQNQILVKPEEDRLHYQAIVRASASTGSGVEGLLPFPTEAMEIEVNGEDLRSTEKVTTGNGPNVIRLTWNTRNVLERTLFVSYSMPLRPLDRTWKLQGPCVEGTPTRFVIPQMPLLEFKADGLSEPLAPLGLPATFRSELGGDSYRRIEGGNQVEIMVTHIPIAATDEATVREASWTQAIEPDGSMLATGVLTAEHKSPHGCLIDTPPGMKLLSCEVEGKQVSPADMGEGKLRISLPAGNGGSRIQIRFTGSVPALDPIEGTIELSLPRLPLFIHTLQWRIELPPGYTAETHGNLARAPVPPGEPPQRILLHKNLCRNERPSTRIFYQRTNLNR